MATGTFNPNQSGTSLRSWEKSNSNIDDSISLEPGKPDISFDKHIGNFSSISTYPNTNTPYNVANTSHPSDTMGTFINNIIQSAIYKMKNEN